MPGSPEQPPLKRRKACKKAAFCGQNYRIKGGEGRLRRDNTREILAIRRRFFAAVAAYLGLCQVKSFSCRKGSIYPIAVSKFSPLKP